MSKETIKSRALSSLKMLKSVREYQKQVEGQTSLKLGGGSDGI